MNKVKQTGLWLGALLLGSFLIACDEGGGTEPVPPPDDPSSSSGTIIDLSSSTDAGNPGNSFIGVGANPAIIDTWYEGWKTKYFVTLADDINSGSSDQYNNIFAGTGMNPGRIKWDGTSNGCNKAAGNCSVSEGIGYGMLISMFQDDWVVFNALYEYTSGFLSVFNASGEAPNLMYWITDSFNDYKDISAATDADLDIATSLILAAKKLEAVDPGLANTYRTWALKVANSVWDYLIMGNCNSGYLVCSGNSAMWYPPAKDPELDGIFNLSYFSPVAYRLFATIDPAHNWQAVIDANYAYMQQVQATGAGLLPDWSNAAGVAALAPNGTSAQSYDTYDKEALRIAWRIAWDYHWFGAPEAKAVLDKMANFIVTYTGGNVGSLPANLFKMDGSLNMARRPQGYAHLGSYCLMGVASYPDWYAACQATFNNSGWNASYGYYTQILQLMFGQLMNGKYQNPF